MKTKGGSMEEQLNHLRTHPEDGPAGGSAGRPQGHPRFSVVIPTYQRRDLVVRSVWSLAHQEFVGDFEVIVVVDGSHDGSAEALRQLTPLAPPFPLTVLEQSNQGAASARNRGAAAACGEILLFL